MNNNYHTQLNRPSNGIKPTNVLNEVANNNNLLYQQHMNYMHNLNQTPIKPGAVPNQPNQSTSNDIEIELSDTITNIDQPPLNTTRPVYKPNQIPNIPNQIPQIPNVLNQIPNVPSQIPNVPNQIPNVLNQVPNIPNQVPNVLNQVPNVLNQVPNPLSNSKNKVNDNKSIESFDTVVLTKPVESTDQNKNHGTNLTSKSSIKPSIKPSTKTSCAPPFDSNRIINYLVIPILLFILFIILVGPFFSEHITKYFYPITEFKGYATRGGFISVSYMIIKFLTSIV